MADIERDFREYLKANPDAGGDYTFFRAGWEAAARMYRSRIRNFFGDLQRREDKAFEKMEQQLLEDS